MGVLDVTYPAAIAFLSPSEKKFGEMLLLDLISTIKSGTNSTKLRLVFFNRQRKQKTYQAIAGFFFRVVLFIYSFVWDRLPPDVANHNLLCYIKRSRYEFIYLHD